jgi:hypothetical protein
MGFFDSLTEVLTGQNQDDIKKYAGNAQLNLGNIFLPGGMGGGASNTVALGSFQGYGGSPLNQKDWEGLNSVFGAVRDANSFEDINWNAGNFRGANFQGNPLSPEANKFLSTNWSTIRSAGKLADIDWSSGIVGSPGYAPEPGTPGAGGAPAAPTSTLGDLEPARNAFAGLAAQQAGQVGQNTQGNILELMRQQAAPQEQRAFNGLNNNLFMRGRLGGDDSATGEAYRGFARGQSEADIGRQLTSFGLADQLQTSALNRSLGATAGAEGLTKLSTLPFDMALKLAMAKSGGASAAAGIAGSGQGLLDMWNKFMGGGGGSGGGGGFFGMKG